MHAKPAVPGTKRKRRWFIAGAALLAVTVLLRSLSDSGPTDSKPERVLSEARLAYEGLASSPPEFRAAPTPTATSPSITSPGIAGSNRVASAVSKAFPSITEKVQDWRKFRPEIMTVAAYADLPLTFTRVAVKDEGKYVTWIGQIAGLPGASLIGVATEKGYDAILVVPGAPQFSFHVRGEQVVIDEAAPGEEGCGVDPVQLPKAPIVGAPSVLTVVEAPQAQADTALVATGPKVEVDVLFGYDADTLAAAAAQSSDPVGYIDGQCKAMIEASNVALNQSGVSNFIWRHLGVVAAPAYTRTKTLSDDLDALAPGGPLGTWVRTSRTQRGADQFVLFVAGEADFSGIAYNAKQTAIPRDYALAVVKWRTSYQTVAHELAHNFGCKHDRAHANAKSSDDAGTPAPDNDGFWCYGQLWQNPPLPSGYTGNSGTGGTIMSYADYRIPYFSNPNITVRLTGSLLGWGSINPDLGTQQIGRPEDGPAGAYNAKVLFDQAPAVSKFQEGLAGPGITQQPVNVNVARGESFTLSVVATGSALEYQWLKGGAAIGGATASSYTKVADGTEPDAYSVTVSNSRGSVTSNSVNVTVTVPAAGGSAPTPVTSNSSGGGGGGGGGAPSGWFFGAAAVLSLMRWSRRLGRGRG